MKLDDWFETYERDGGELMLFNSLDMEAAYKAGYAEAIEAAANKARDHQEIAQCDEINTLIFIEELRALKEKA